MPLQTGILISRHFGGSEVMLLFSRKPHSELSSTIRLYHAQGNQASLVVIGSAKLQMTFCQGSILVNLLEEQKNFRAQRYCSTAGKCDKMKGRMPIFPGLSVTFGAVIRFKFPFASHKRLLGKWYSMCYLTFLSPTTQGFNKGSSHLQPAKKQRNSIFTTATAKIATNESFQIMQASSTMLEGEKLLKSSEMVIVKPRTLVVEERKVSSGSHFLEEERIGDYFLQEKVPSDGICDSSSKSDFSCEQHEFIPIDKDGDVENGIRGCSACSTSEPKSEVTIIAFDIETTGLSLSEDRIIEFAARDLAGGNCSTLQTLVNPGRTVPYSVTLVHGINDKMVNRSDVPSWREVAVAILQFVEIRRKGGPVILVAHNGKRFDVPFIMKEFHECSMEFPSWWHFVDSLSLAREAMKANGLKVQSLKLSFLHDVYYGLPTQGRAHRAMADVHMLASVFGMLMKDLQLSVSELLERTFKAEHVTAKMIKALVPLPGVFSLKEKPQKELQSVSSAVEDDKVSNSNDEDDIDLAEVNVTRLEASGEGISVPWEDSHVDDFEVDNIGKGYLQLVQGVSKNDETQENRFIIDEEKSLSLSDSIQPSRKLHHLAISRTVQREDGVFQFQNESRDPLKLQSCEMAFTLELENVDSDPASMGTRQLQGSSIDKWTETGNQVFSSIFKTLTDVIDSPQQKPALGDEMDIMGEIVTSNFGCSINKSSASDIWASHTSSVDTSLLSPLLKQYVKTKRKRPRFLLLSRVGDFYEAFFEDAERLAMICNLKCGAVNGGKLLERRVPMTGVPHDKIKLYLHMLLRKGIAIVKQDQVTAAGKSRTFVKRQITEILTPGTVLDDGMLEGSCNNYLVSIVPPCDDDGNWGLAYADISTGEFYATQSGGRRSLTQEILRLQPAEIIFPSNVTCIMDENVDSSQPIGLPSCMCYSSRLFSDFSMDQAEKELFLDVDTSDVSFNHPFAIRAAGALLRYVREIQGIPERELPFQKLCSYLIEDALRLDDTVKSHLELIKTARWENPEGTLVWAMSYTKTSMGTRMLKKWILRPLLKHEDITFRHDVVESLATNNEVRTRLRTLIASIGDLERLIGRIAWMRAEARDLLALAQAIQKLPQLSTTLAMMPINKYFTAVMTIPELALDLAQKIQVGYTKPFRKRRHIKIKTENSKDQAIPENYQKLQTMKNDDRLITSKLLGYERKRLDAMSKACEREEEILDVLKDEAAKVSKSLQDLTQAIAAIDVLSTFAELAVRRNYIRPEILKSGRELTIVSGRNPVVELRLSEQSMFIPNSTYLGYNPSKSLASEAFSENLFEGDAQSKEKNEKLWPRSDLILLTGPHSSGKSCYLRQIGLIQILAQAGSFVPAKSARLSIVDAVFTGVGAVPDLLAGQSTLEAEMVESANILNCATSNSLVLLDEIGQGTGSQEGEAIARAVIEYLSQHIMARTVFSTHFHKLHEVDMEFSNISNYHFEAHETESGSIAFEHVVKPGFSLQSYGVALGRVAGLPEWVSNRASELLSYKDDHSILYKLDDSSTSRPTSENINAVADLDEAAFIIPQGMETLENSSSDVSAATSSHPDEPFNWRSWLRRKWKGIKNNRTTMVAGQSPTLDTYSANEPDVAGSDNRFSKEELKETWENVSKVLQNQPATLALAKQKGSLLDISKTSGIFHVKVGASELFVKKFEQHEHAIAMEAAFQTVLKQPINLEIFTITTVEE